MVYTDVLVEDTLISGNPNTVQLELNVLCLFQKLPSLFRLPYSIKVFRISSDLCFKYLPNEAY